MANQLRDVELHLNIRNTSEHWYHVFRKYDKNGDGDLSLRELDNMLNSQDYEHDIPEHVVKKIHTMADTNQDGKLDINEFIYMIHHPDLQHIFKDLLNRYVHLLLPPVQHVAQLRQTATLGQYEEEYSCCPPPIGMILISLIMLILYCVDVSQSSEFSILGSVGTALVYSPSKRQEIWRFVTYMFVHLGVMHLIVNLGTQILLGIPLEMVHTWWRVMIVYLSGVIAGSLGTSVTDPHVYLAGASGGVYAIITAHIASIIMNWKEMRYALIQLLIFVGVTGCDLGTAIYNRYVLNINNNIGYTAHLAGALAGLLVGINVLRNIEVTKTEKVIWWSSIIIFTILMGAAVCWNIGYIKYYPAK